MVKVSRFNTSVMVCDQLHLLNVVDSWAATGHFTCETLSGLGCKAYDCFPDTMRVVSHFEVA